MVAAANDAIEDNAAAFDTEHLARPVIDDSLDSLEDSMNLITVRQHLLVIPEPAVLLPGIDGTHDFILGADLHQLSNL
jgi:hypothetical protein